MGEGEAQERKGGLGRQWGKMRPEGKSSQREAACGVVDEGLLTRIFNTQLDLFLVLVAGLSQVAQTSVKQIETAICLRYFRIQSYHGVGLC